jgi:hypothetical protein
MSVECGKAESQDFLPAKFCGRLWTDRRTVCRAPSFMCATQESLQIHQSMFETKWGKNCTNKDNILFNAMRYNNKHLYVYSMKSYVSYRTNWLLCKHKNDTLLFIMCLSLRTWHVIYTTLPLNMIILDLYNSPFTLALIFTHAKTFYAMKLVLHMVHGNLFSIFMVIVTPWFFFLNIF